MCKNLTDKIWQYFNLKDLFVNYHGKRLIKSERSFGKIPLLTASEINQGVSDYISQNKKMNIHSDFISIDMFGHAFYHNYACYGDDNIYFFKNNNISKNAKLFITTCINKNQSKYTYGNQFRQDNANKDKIMLPVNSKGEPDYEFMEEYIKEKETKLKQEYKTYIQKRVTQLQKKVDIENKKWKIYNIYELFNIYTGTDLIINKIQNGNIPVISHTALNNGIACYSYDIYKRKLFNFKQTISLADRGNFKAFVQKQNFYIGTRVKALESKAKIPYYALFFIAKCIDKQHVKFSYGYNACNNTGAIKIMLPINSKNEPDYEFMHDYMLYLEQKKILEYLEYINE